MKTNRDFIHVDGPNYHIRRRREIIAAHPEVRELYGPYQMSAVYIVLIVASQLAIAYFLRQQAWWLVALVAYVVGAFANHSLYVMIHECTHNVVLKTSLGNKIMGLVCDMPLVLPSAMGFRKYHMIHHKHLGEYSYDPDIVSHTEAKLVGNSAIKKAIWLMFFSISQGLRPLKVKFYRPLNIWTAVNVVMNLIINVAMYVYVGPMALLYIALSTLFALGLHPLGGRWIQEHFITKEGQETYSYYGPLNKIAFNMGYHNEHHDFMNVPWINQPKIKKLAPEYYDTLASYKSWTKVILTFIFNRQMDSYTRMVHPDRHPKAQAVDNELNLYSKEVIEVFY
ncbi:MAG: fatty acid desaturase [Bdellovibrionales bacterium]|nr:fatty acid desaturase [Bdellovibrionales bacterium]